MNRGTNQRKTGYKEVTVGKNIIKKLWRAVITHI